MPLAKINLIIIISICLFNINSYCSDGNYDSLTITSILTNNITIDFEWDVRPYMGSGNKENIIIKYFQSELKKGIKLRTTLTPIETSTPVLKTINIPKNEYSTINIIVPDITSSGDILNKANISLVIDSLNIDYNRNFTIIPAGNKIKTFMRPELEISANITFWDNSNDKLIITNKISSIIPIFSQINLVTWQTIIASFVDQLTIKSPFHLWTNSDNTINREYFSPENSDFGDIRLARDKFYLKYMPTYPNNEIHSKYLNNTIRKENSIYKKIGFTGKNLRPYIENSPEANKELNKYAVKRTSIILGSAATAALLVTSLVTGLEKEKTGTTYGPNPKTGKWEYSDTYDINVKPHFKYTISSTGILAIYTFVCALSNYRNLNKSIKIYNNTN